MLLLSLIHFINKRRKLHITVGLLLSQFIIIIILACPLIFDVCLSMAQVTVTPNDRDACIRLGFQCSSATVTLHDKNTLILPAEPPDPEESAGNFVGSD